MYIAKKASLVIGSMVVGFGMLALVAVAGAQEHQGSNQPPRFEESIVVTATPRSGSPLDHVLTFSGPVGIPGATLPAGSYVFRFPSSNTKVIQVLKGDRSKVYSMFQTIPVRQIKKEATSEGYEMTFKERAADAPRAINAWFLPSGDGYEFIYPK